VLGVLVPYDDNLVAAKCGVPRLAVADDHGHEVFIREPVEQYRFGSVQLTSLSLQLVDCFWEKALDDVHNRVSKLENLGVRPVVLGQLDNVRNVDFAALKNIFEVVESKPNSFCDGLGSVSTEEHVVSGCCNK